MVETDQKQLLKSITAFLEKNKISYMITGAWSVIYYARPRASHDIDFLVEIDTKELPRILQVFRKLTDDYFVDARLIEKHLIDAAFVYQIQEKNLDKDYLRTWAKKQKTTKLLHEIATIDLEVHY